MGSGSSKERDGLFILTTDRQDRPVHAYTGTPHLPYNIDIVAVHGLGGHWCDTWKAKNGQFWLQDFLPAQFPNARVMSFGYDSDIVFSSAITDITDVARMLLERLHGARQTAEEKRRPILFISHSLGGIVVKKALIDGHLDSKMLQRYGDILGKVCGFVFFAVPHNGSDAASWASFAARISKILLLGYANKKFVAALLRDSGTLAEISQKFVQIGAAGILIRTFYETRMTSNQLIVDKDSACLGLPFEAAVGIGSADHRDVCKFDNASSQKYLPVKNAIEELVEFGIRKTTEEYYPYAYGVPYVWPSHYGGPYRRVTT